MKRLPILTICFLAFALTTFSQGNNWRQMPGAAMDIAAGADGSIWIIGTDRQTGGYGIYKWRSNNWSRVNNNGGERVAVDRSGDAWVITSDNAVSPTRKILGSNARSRQRYFNRRERHDLDYRHGHAG